ncbi:hypothetical protein HL666_14820 [Bradyrhizobium sp. 83002]|uniref:hypothetical protein n=1 Tax=Bradyrhizobium aeschynomenes TaxID=2734909 RepID=UPI00155600EF|nr:hypothetical protein [Bradyrhizobium aeschynomenes]NPU12042.1 hypothetical protein [Bradyrhizobium aeschynomenes]
MANLERYAAQIAAAEDDVRKAMEDYRRGGTPNKLNKANDRLADALADFRDCSGGAVPRQWRDTVRTRPA